MKTILWHDYETTGISPSRDRPVQFAAQRTDESLQPVGEPVTLYCQLSADVLPSPEATLVTGLGPQDINRQGLPEAEFANRLWQLFSQPGTCGAGYNSLRFDDEVTRYTFWRNLIDPYAREWKQGNSRWDIIDMVRLVAFMRPDALQWPTDDQGKISFKLENLSVANGIVHQSAHDALSDVQATIGLARLIREREPKLYDYCWQLRQKSFVEERINWQDRRPFIHISGRLPAERGRAGLFMPVARLKNNRNAFVALDLSSSPHELLSMSDVEVRERLFVDRDSLGDLSRPPLKQIHVNRSPIILPLSMLDEQLAKARGFDLSACETHWQQAVASDLPNRDWDSVFAFQQEGPVDPELDLYGGFLADADRQLADRARELLPDEMRDCETAFKDPRMAELLFRYRARNWPESLDADESKRWSSWVSNRLLNGEPFGEPLDELISRCRELQQGSESHSARLAPLMTYYQSLLKNGSAA